MIMVVRNSEIALAVGNRCYADQTGRCKCTMFLFSSPKVVHDCIYHRKHIHVFICPLSVEASDQYGDPYVLAYLAQ